MKFKIINEDKNTVFESNLTIDQARDMASTLNMSKSSDYFYIQADKETNTVDLKHLISEHHNDADLGRYIRKLYK